MIALALTTFLGPALVALVLLGALVLILSLRRRPWDPEDFHDDDDDDQLTP